MLANLVICFSMTLGSVASATEAFLDEAISELGFESTHKADIRSGRIISVGLPSLERQPTELTVGAAMMLVRRPLGAVSQALLSDDTFRVNIKILDFRAIGDGNASREEIGGTFRGIGYGEAESEEAGKLLKAEPGESFNLSKREIDEFRSLQALDGRVHETVSSALAQMLQRRFTDYLRGGLAAVEPYARKYGKSASPYQELRTAFSSLRLLKKHFPTFYSDLTGFPAPSSPDTENRFYWTKRLADGRPAFVLSHRMVERQDGYTAAMELQFYAQHSYNSMLTLLVCLPFEGGTLVLSAIRVYTDQVTGFPSAMKKRIGRERLTEAMTEYFREIRQVLERQ
jgi:hypothetical protein